jgi:hypothetical protein
VDRLACIGAHDGCRPVVHLAVAFTSAVSQGLERARAAGQARDGDSKFVTEELAAVQRAVKRASVKSSILDEKKRFGRDVVIGISTYAAFAPIVGSSSAAIGASMATSRSLASLAWRWFTFGKKSADEQRIGRCFSALVDNSTRRPSHTDEAH